MKPDPAKVTAIVEMPVPEDKAAVRRLLGMINYLASHIPNMASITTPLHVIIAPRYLTSLTRSCNLLSSALHFAQRLAVVLREVFCHALQQYWQQ